MKKLYYLLIIIAITACKEKYVPPFTAPIDGYLVVEGNINNGNTSTNIVLTRTNSLSATDKIYETGAAVTIEGNDNSFFPLNETLKGNYSTSSLNLNSGQQYRLHIVTAAGKEFISDFVPVNSTPVIDSLSWLQDSKGVEIYVNAHNDNDKTRYYQWDYSETWEFHSSYLKVLDYNKKDPEKPFLMYLDSATFGPNKSIITCWNSRASTSLLIGSTARLSENRVYLPVTFIPASAKELSVLYSINVRQFSISKQAYEFFEKMKKNTENTGSIFDAQPSELKGNIHNATDPSEPVIGFVNISSLQEKRLFIQNYELQSWGYRPSCSQLEIDNLPDSIKKAMDGGYLPTEVATNMGPKILTFYVTLTEECYDCTLSGTNVKPPFWP